MNGTTYVWQSEQYTANVTFQINGSKDLYSACLYENRSSGESEELDCRSKRVGNGTTVTVTLTAGNASETGERTLYLQLQPTFGQDVPTLDDRTFDQHVISKDGDEDDDGLTNGFEVNRSEREDWPKNAFLTSDIDSDGLEDGREVNELDTDPTDNDSDDDGLLDGYEMTLGTDPKEADSDGDGISDYKEHRELNSDPTNESDPNTISPKETTTTKQVEPARSDGISGRQLLLLLVVGLGLVGGGVLLWRRGDTDSGPAASASEPSDTDDSAPAPPADDQPGEILTDEGRILQLLHDNRGRMKQVDIVEETGWSKSKVSRLLSRMEERGGVNRLRVGRGNIVYLDGAKPNGVRSPHEEDSYS